MIDPTSNLLGLVEKRENQFSSVLEKVYGAAQPGAVYSERVTVGNYTVITVSEVMAGGGFGSGLGFGPLSGSSPQPGEAQAQQPGDAGIGGGGSSIGRPVAVICIGPDGVTVKPIVDVTRIALLAGVTIWGTLLLGTLLKTRRLTRSPGS